jgi:hypothetical protein
MQRQINQIINTIKTKDKYKLGTSYISNAYLRMLPNYDVTCYQVPSLSQPIDDRESFANVGFYILNEPKPEVFSDLDCLISFEGVKHHDFMTKLQEQIKIPAINYEMCLSINIHDDAEFISKKHPRVRRIYPTESFKKFVKGDGEVVFPPIKYENFHLPIENRKLYAITIGNSLMEGELVTNFSAWRTIGNAMSTQVFGLNPLMRPPTYFPQYRDLAQIYNSSKVYVNTRTRGEFPLEVLEAMAYGCIVISFKYPGIEDIIKPGGLNAIVENGEECRAWIAKATASLDAQKQSYENMEFIREHAKPQELESVINKAIKDNYEGKYSFYK